MRNRSGTGQTGYQVKTKRCCIERNVNIKHVSSLHNQYIFLAVVYGQITVSKRNVHVSSISERY